MGKGIWQDKNPKACIIQSEKNENKFHLLLCNRFQGLYMEDQNIVQILYLWLLTLQILKTVRKRFK